MKFLPNLYTIKELAIISTSYTTLLSVQFSVTLQSVLPCGAKFLRSIIFAVLKERWPTLPASIVQLVNDGGHFDIRNSNLKQRLVC